MKISVREIKPLVGLFSPTSIPLNEVGGLIGNCRQNPNGGFQFSKLIYAGIPISPHIDDVHFMLIPISTNNAYWLPTLPNDILEELTQTAFAWVMQYGGEVLLNECNPANMQGQYRRSAADEHWHFFKHNIQQQSEMIEVEYDKQDMMFIKGITTPEELKNALRENQDFSNCYSVAIWKNEDGSVTLGFTRNQVRPHLPLGFVSSRHVVPETEPNMLTSLKAAQAFRDSLPQ